MKAPIVEKSTLKGIIIGFSICCLLSLTVFVSKAVNFEAYRINSPEKELTQEKRNSLVTTGIEKFLNKYNDEDLYKYKFPIGTVVMYAKSGGCPKGWEQWGDGLDGKFIMPLQTTDGTALMYGGSKSFTILNENLPKHSHKFIYDGQGSAGVSESTYLALNNYGNQNYGDYDLKFNSNVATVGLTSREGGDEPIEFMPKYAKVLFCIKVSEGEADDSGEYVESPLCGTKDKLTGEPTTLAEKCSIGDPSSVVLSNGVYRWTCTTGGNSIDCYSSAGTYTVEFNCNGGSNAPADQTFTVGSSQALHPNTCTRTSYAFKGWKTEGGTKVYDDKANVDLGGSAGSTVVLHAVWSSASCFFPTMVIDKIENCIMSYHFVEFNPISGKTCCEEASLRRSSDGVSGWSPITTTYNSPLLGSSIGSNGSSGMIYFRYAYAGCKGEYSPVYSYNMPVQSGCPTGGSSGMKKSFYNGKCLEWKNNGLYDVNGKLITTISGWKVAGYGYDERYKTMATPHWVIWYDNDTTTWGSYSDSYLDYTDRDKILQAGYSFPLTVYHPGTSNQWHRMTINNEGYAQSVVQYGIGNLYSSTCTN